MNVSTRLQNRSLTTLALAGLVGLALAVAPALAEGAGAQDPAGSGVPDLTPEQEQPRQIQVKILGMSCPFCVYGAEQKLKRLDGVKELDVELETGIATLTMEDEADVSNEKLKTTVDDAGFEAAAIVRSFPSEFEDWNPEELPGSSGTSAFEGSRRNYPM